MSAGSGTRDGACGQALINLKNEQTSRTAVREKPAWMTGPHSYLLLSPRQRDRREWVESTRSLTMRR
ncbi:hypothetical protein B0G80_4853 [Paraburkholderia sp. BL6669N2]|nr:hypothetical protein B0G80_4853 [Paraburkholderia sp. BL6669N2]